MHVVFQAEVLLSQPQISKPVLLTTLQPGISPWHLPPFKWETVSKRLGCRHQKECNLHSQIAHSVHRTAPEIYSKLLSNASNAIRLLQRIYCNASVAQQLTTCKSMWASRGSVHSGELLKAGCLRTFASSLCVCCVSV